MPKKVLSIFTQKRALLAKDSEFNIANRGNSNSINLVIGDQIAKPMFITPYDLERINGSNYPVGKATCIHINIGNHQYLSIYRRFMPKNAFGTHSDPLFNIQLPDLDKSILKEALTYKGLMPDVKLQLDDNLIYAIKESILLFTNKSEAKFTIRETEIYADYETPSTYPDFDELHKWLKINIADKLNKE